MLAETLAEARGRGVQVAAGRAEELEQGRPFGLVAGAFGCVRSAPDRRRAAIGELLVTGGAGDEGPITVTSDPGLQFRVVDAFADLAEELALSGPLLIAVDDLQWADPCSLLTLGVLSRRLARLPVALIGCYRPYAVMPTGHLAKIKRTDQPCPASGTAAPTSPTSRSTRRPGTRDR